MGSFSAMRRVAGVTAAAMTLVLVLVGCRPPAGPVGSYRVTGIYDAQQQLVPVLAGSTITLTLDRDGKLSGNGGCNGYSGSWTAPGPQRISVGDIASTDMACGEPDGVMAQEYAYLSGLAETATWVRRGDMTVTFASRGEPSYLIFEAERV
jgi:hypothetical protein